MALISRFKACAELLALILKCNEGFHPAYDAVVFNTFEGSCHGTKNPSESRPANRMKAGVCFVASRSVLDTWDRDTTDLPEPNQVIMSQTSCNALMCCNEILTSSYCFDFFSGLALQASNNSHLQHWGWTEPVKEAVLLLRGDWENHIVWKKSSFSSSAKMVNTAGYISKR